MFLKITATVLVMMFVLDMVASAAMRIQDYDDKRQYFDSLGGLALGKRAQHMAKVASELNEYLNDVRVLHALEAELANEKMSRHEIAKKRVVFDSLGSGGGNYLF